MKKLICVLLALAMCLGLGTSALAESAASDFEYEVEDGQAIITDYLGEALNVVVPSRIGGYPVTAIGVAAFEGREDLMYIEIPEGVTEIGLEAFTFCTYLTGAMLPDSLTSIGDYAFAGCEALSLTDEMLPDSLTRIGDYAFADCKALREITIPSSVTDIGDYAFSNCTGLTSVTILGTDVLLGEDAFGGCESLTDIIASNQLIAELSQYPQAPGATDAAAPAPGADNVLPDAHAFFNEELTHSEESITNGTQVVFSIEQAYASAAYEYADLLQSGRFGLTLTKSWDTDAGGGKSSYYLFDCGSIGEDQQIKDYADGAYRYGDVILQINDWPRYGWCEIAICFSDGLTVEDTGDRCTISGIVDHMKHGFSGPMGGGSSGGDSSGGSGGSSSGSSIFDDDDDYTPYKPETKCYKCHGSGEITCSQCGGTGYETRYVSSPNYSGSSTTSDTSRVTCGKCHGSGDVTCPACGGSGKG